MTVTRWRMNSSSSSLKFSVARLAVDQRQEDDRKRILQRRVLVELVEHHLGIGVAFDVDDQPHRLLQIALVANARDALDPCRC
jgi:elongation factor P--beta-lysine ligase